MCFKPAISIVLRLFQSFFVDVARFSPTSTVMIFFDASLLVSNFLYFEKRKHKCLETINEIATILLSKYSRRVV